MSKTKTAARLTPMARSKRDRVQGEAPSDEAINEPRKRPFFEACGGRAPYLFVALSVSSFGWVGCSAVLSSLLLPNTFVWRPFTLTAFFLGMLLGSKIAALQRLAQRSLMPAFLFELAHLPGLVLLYLAFARNFKWLPLLCWFFPLIAGGAFITTSFFINENFRWKENDELTIYIPSWVGAMAGIFLAEILARFFSPIFSATCFTVLNSLTLLLIAYLVRFEPCRPPSKGLLSLICTAFLFLIAIFWMLVVSPTQRMLQTFYFGITT